MCGRFTLKTPVSQLAKFFQFLPTFTPAPRYNIAPTQQVLAVRRTGTDAGDGAGAQREAAAMHWGLIPSWSKDVKMGARMINARSETVATKPAFRSAFRSRRCLIPSDGFYEWLKKDARTKQPFYIRMRDERPFAFAGLWETWGRDESAVESCTIITTDANDLLRSLHDRMPVILEEEDYDRWLDPELNAKDELLPLLVPYPDGAMEAYPVSTLVSSPKNDLRECIDPIDKEIALGSGITQPENVDRRQKRLDI